MGTNSKGTQQRKNTISKTGALWIICLIILWGAAILMFIRANGNLGLEELLNYQPENKALSFAAMFFLFLIKSVDLIIHSAILYSLSGIMYSLPLALCVNLAGICIMSAVPYAIGRSLGADAAARFREKYPKLCIGDSIGLGSFMLAFLLRCIGVPIVIVGMYLGAKKINFKQYLAASVLGLSLSMVPYTVIADNALEMGLSSAVPVIAAVHLLTVALAFLLHKIILKIKSKKNK